MSPADFPTFGFEHNAYLIGCMFFWLFVPIVGKKYLNHSQRVGMVIFLAVITVSQDIIFDFFQLFIVAVSEPVSCCSGAQYFPDNERRPE